MTHPIFFSFAGDTRDLVERLKAKFSDDLVYMYTRTGTDGINFPEEILEELAQCELFVIFWSKAYTSGDVRRPWCSRELLTARKRMFSGSLSRTLIVQVDDTSFDQMIRDPDTGDLVDGLKPFRDERRAFTAPINERAIEQRIAFELSQLGDRQLPTLPRPTFEQRLRDALNTGSYQSKTPITFVNGFHGTGRKTLIRQVMGSDFRHLTEYVLPLDASDGPEDLLRLIWGEVLQRSVNEQRQMMREVEKKPAQLLEYYRRLGDLLVERRAYIVLAKDELTEVAETMPFWITEYFNAFLPKVQPLIFATVPRPLPGAFKSRLAHMGEVDVPTLEDEESEQLVSMHIAARDPKRVARWQEHIPFILEAGANSPKLLIDIVRLASRRPSLDFLKIDAAADIARFDERVAKFLDWAWAQIKDRADHVLLVDVLNSLTVAHYDTLEELFKPLRRPIGETLYDLSQVGLVEQLTESTYRVPAALRRKLNFYLVNSEQRQQSGVLLRRFAKTVRIGDDEFGGVTLTNMLQIRLAEDAPLDEQDQAFVTAAMLFKAGWQKYRRTHYASALSLLKRAFSKMAMVRDDSTKLEIARYYGLAAAREASEEDLNEAIRYLGRAINFTPRVFERALPTASFIRGFSHRLNQNYDEALACFEQALEQIPEAPHTDQTRSTVMNEMVQCLLKLPRPEYSRAVALAERACSIRTTANNLDILVRALVAQTYEDPDIRKDQVERNFDKIEMWEKELRQRCEGSHLSFYEARVVDRLEKEAIEEVRAENLPFGHLDLTAAIDRCHSAYLQYQEEALLTRTWDLMLNTEVGRNWNALHQEVSRYLQQGTLNRMGRGVAARIRILTFDQTDESARRTAFAELDKYRANQTIPRLVALDVRRKLELGDLSKSRVVEYVLK